MSSSQIVAARRLAIEALAAYPVAEPAVRFIAQGENTTFRVDASLLVDTPRGTRPEPARFLLRIHRPGRHGRQIDSAAAIRSELAWLQALRADTQLAVPEPQRTNGGQLITSAESEGIDGHRYCSLLRWMDGRRCTASARPVHLRRLGRAMAALHCQADAWTPPSDFVRTTWDEETFFGNTMRYGGTDARDVWAMLPGGLRSNFETVAMRARMVMTTLGRGPEAFGLIHADLHLDNTLFHGDHARLIDFDDCGTGWRIYDVAVALWELRHRDDYPSYRDALIEGYTEHRALPPEQIEHIDLFIAVREVAFGLWIVGTSQTDAGPRSRLDKELAFIGGSLERLLPAGTLTS